MKTKISVVMCVFNTSNYLEKSINSVLNQTYSNIEFIIVDDASTDNSFEIAERITKGYDNVKIFRNIKNMGAAFSRNFGVSEATGKYIGFIDSDDYVDKDYFERMQKEIEKKRADIAICDILSVYNDKKERISVCNGIISKENIINNGLAASTCNKLFKLSIIKKYPFPVGLTTEDVATVIPCIVDAKKIAYVSDVVYNYLQRKDSVQNSCYSEKKMDIFEVLELTFDRIKNSKEFSKYKDALIFNQLILLLFYYLVPLKINFIKRYFIINNYNHKINKYNIEQNQYYMAFFTELGIYHKKFYNMLVRLIILKMNFAVDLLISFYHFYNNNIVKKVIPENITYNDVISLAKKQNDKRKVKKTISVVIPNYNYSDYLIQRLYSILNQTYKISEIIILDDCSVDNSRQLIDKFESDVKNYIKIAKIYNEKNSGSAFMQWKKGFELATCDYVWIAEADDYCDKNYLKFVIKPCLKKNNIVLSYSDTSFIDSNGKVIQKSVINQIDFSKSGHWDKKYLNNGVSEFSEYEYLNCTIANVSSCIMKKSDFNYEFELSSKYKQAGDWLFYANIMRKGDVSYCNKTLNYYRIHGNNVTSITSKKNHFDEIKRIHKFFDDKYGLSNFQKIEINKRYDYLIKAWGLNEEDLK